MVNKAFEHTIRFYQVSVSGGATVWVPIITVNLLQPNGNRVAVPLLFDTGASTTTLRDDLYPLLGVSSWDSGDPVDTLTAGGVNPVKAYRYQAKLELLGKVVECPIHLQILPKNPLYMGLLGRERLFDEFGFGFWERTHDLYCTVSP